MAATGAGSVPPAGSSVGAGVGPSAVGSGVGPSAVDVGAPAGSGEGWLEHPPARAALRVAKMAVVVIGRSEELMTRS